MDFMPSTCTPELAWALSLPAQPRPRTPQASELGGGAIAFRTPSGGHGRGVHYHDSHGAGRPRIPGLPGTVSGTEHHGGLVIVGRPTAYEADGGLG